MICSITFSAACASIYMNMGRAVGLPVNSCHYIATLRELVFAAGAASIVQFSRDFVISA